ncbi:hypothetical protein RND81_07G169400 [Saponaria officinalis]|uniref:Protein FAR1-RELATED SEQUENCE n=1 Tax=Saponaria officinalis TaxID=3572 RepID=A0AAW1JPC2_SAPOF
MLDGTMESQVAEQNVGDKPRRKTKVRRIGCQTMIRVSGVKGLIVVDRFRTGHNHELVDVKDRQFQKLARRLHKYHKELIVMNSRLFLGPFFRLIVFWSEVYETVGLLKARSKDDIESFCGLIRDFRQKLEPTIEDLSKEHEIVQLLGCSAVAEIQILPPKLARNKGSGRRMLSSNTLAVAKAAKPKRLCGNCKQMAHHDKRNCPNPYAQRPPPLPESSSDGDDDDEELEEDDDSD